MRNDTRPARLTRLIRFFFFAAVVAAGQPLHAQALKPQPPIELTGTHGKFDFIKVDEASGRLLACHTQNGSLDVIDEATSKLIKSIPTGAAQGVALDVKGGRYFVSCSKPPQLVIIDSAKLEATGTVPLPGPADVCTYSATINRVVVDNDDKPEQWWIDPEAKQIVQTITYPGAGMEDLVFNEDSTELIQNLKDSNEVAIFNSAAHVASEKTPEADYVPVLEQTAPAEKPHGLAIMGSDSVLVAGGNGKLVLLNYKTGKGTASTEIAPRVDEIAYDSASGKVYCASGTGVISAVSVGKDTLGKAESIPSAQGTHSIAVDSKAHTVWIAFAKGDKAYVQSFHETSP